MIPTGQRVKRISKAAIAYVGWVWFGGCTLMMDVPQPLEPVNGEFYYDPHPAAIYGVYGVKLPERRMIRQVIIHSRDPLRGTDIYVRERVDSWEHVEARKVMDAEADKDLRQSNRRHRAHHTQDPRAGRHHQC